MNELTLNFGALCEPISKQLAGRISKENGRAFDKDSAAITRLRVRGFLTDSESRKATKRLVKEIGAAIVSE